CGIRKHGAHLTVNRARTSRIPIVNAKETLAGSRRGSGCTAPFADGTPWAELAGVESHRVGSALGWSTSAALVSAQPPSRNYLRNDHIDDCRLAAAIGFETALQCILQFFRIGHLLAVTTDAFGDLHEVRRVDVGAVVEIDFRG